MALTIDYLYKFCLNLIKKNQSGGITAVEFGFQWNAAQSAYMSDLLGRFQARSNGKEGNNTGLIQNETIMTKLTPFTISYSLPIVTGVGAKPADFLYTLALRINNAPVFQVNKDALWAMLDDVIDPPSETEDCYYYTEYGNNYKFYPATVTQADMDYIQSPPDVLWAFILDGSGRQVYDPSNSVQSKWDDLSNREVTERMLKTIGVSFKDQDFAGFGQSVQLTGE
jgi:hypothetical protein